MKLFATTRFFFAAVFSFAVVTCVVFPTLLRAQTPRFDANDITLKSTPNNPGAFETVSLSVESFLFNVNSQKITWTVDNKVVRSGIGLTTFSTETKALGSTTTVQVSVEVGGETIRKSVVFRPAEIDVIWESANGYTPPFYRGRALPTKESMIRVVALPSAKVGSVTLKPSDFTYTWKKAGGIVNAASGYSKNTYVFQGDVLNPITNLSLTIAGVGNNYTATKDLTVPVFPPRILLYERHPLLGIQYQRELGSSIILPVGEKTILAEPYFFSVLGPTSNYLNYKWKINDVAVATPSKPNQLTLRGSGQVGESRVSLEIENITKLFEEASRFLSITLTK
jgi:hypothetical protein